MNLGLDDRHKNHPVDPAYIRKQTRIILNAMGAHDTELSIVLVNDQEIARLNKTYLNRSGPTNVIAFPMQEGLFSDINPGLLGDVVISMDTVAREARESGLTIPTRFNELLVHGVLHLFGYDHEMNGMKAQDMKAKEKEILALL